MYFRSRNPNSESELSHRVWITSKNWRNFKFLQKHIELWSGHVIYVSSYKSDSLIKIYHVHLFQFNIKAFKAPKKYGGLTGYVIHVFNITSTLGFRHNLRIFFFTFVHLSAIQRLIAQVGSPKVFQTGEWNLLDRPTTFNLRILFFESIAWPLTATSRCCLSHLLFSCPALSSYWRMHDIVRDLDCYEMCSRQQERYQDLRTDRPIIKRDASS